MADARPTFPLPQRYTQRKTEAVQPPDDRTYSAEVTSFPSNLPHHRSALMCFPEKSADSPYTRSIMIPPISLFVKHNFRKNHKNFYEFSVNIEIDFCPKNGLREGPQALPYYIILNYARYLGWQVRWTPRRLKVFSSTADRITLEWTSQPRSLLSCSIASCASGLVAAQMDSAISTSSV